MTEETVRSAEAVLDKKEKVDLKELIMKIVFIIAAVVFIAAVLTICLFIFVQAIPAMAEIGIFEFLFSSDWSPTDGVPKFGIATMIVGSCYVTAGALIVGVPIGLLTATFMAFYCPKPLYKVMKPMTNILAGIPSIIYGWFGLTVIVPLVRSTSSPFSSSVRIPVNSVNALRVPEPSSRLTTRMSPLLPQPTAAKPMPQANAALAIAIRIFFIAFSLLL